VFKKDALSTTIVLAVLVVIDGMVQGSAPAAVLLAAVSKGSPDRTHPLKANITAITWLVSNGTAGEDSDDDALFQYTDILPGRNAA
jgi:hypothetical protein